MRKVLVVLIGLVMVLSFSTSALAKDGLEFYLGGEFQLGINGDPFSDTGDNGTWAGWFKLESTLTKSYGENASMWFKVVVEPDGDLWPAQATWPFEITYAISYAYVYDFADWLTVSAGEFNEWITITDGIVHGDDAWSAQYVWGEPAQGLALKADIKPVDGLTAMAMYRPVGNDYMVKAAYEGDGFRLGADVNNVSTGWDGTSWDVWGEFSPLDGLKIYGDLCALNDPGRTVDQPYLYLVKAEYIHDPITVNAKYCNDWGDWGDYEPNTVEVNVDYGLTEKTTLNFGGAYRVKDTAGYTYDPILDTWVEHTDEPGISTAWAGIAYDRLTLTLTAKVDHDSALSFYASYKIDDTNELEFNYDLDSETWSLTMYMDLY